MNDFHWTKLFNPEFYITMEVGGIPIGIYMVLFIVFAETGLFAGFFLPGDSLLFLSGIYSRELVETFFMIPSDLSNVTILALLIASAATLGNIFGYWFGAKSGQFLYNKILLKTKCDDLLFQATKNVLFQLDQLLFPFHNQRNNLNNSALQTRFQYYQKYYFQY